MEPAEPEAVRLQRATSVRLRRRRDQARKEFLNNRRSGDFGYKSSPAASGEVDDGWDFQSFIQPSAHHDRTSQAVFSDTELDACRCRPRASHRQSRRVRRDPRPGGLPGAPGGGGGGGVKFTDFGFIDQQEERLETRVEQSHHGYLGQAPRHQQQPPPPPPPPRYRSQEISSQLLSLPVTVSDFLQRNDAVILAKSKLWLRRDKFFSKWRERFFTVTSSYLKCFETEEQSVLLWKMGVSDILDVILSDKKGYLTLSITFRKEGRIMLRSSAGIANWFNIIKDLWGREAGVKQQSTAEFWSGRFPLTADTHNVDSWLLQRQFLDDQNKKNFKSPAVRPEKPIYHQHRPGDGEEYHHHHLRHQHHQHHQQDQHHQQQHHRVQARPRSEYQEPHQSLSTVYQQLPRQRTPHRSSNRKIRPKSCIELTENSEGKIYNKLKVTRNLKHEDSGNSSMSGSTPRSVRK